VTIRVVTQPATRITLHTRNNHLSPSQRSGFIYLPQQLLRQCLRFYSQKQLQRMPVAVHAQLLILGVLVSLIVVSAAHLRR
jgi:hypothetical protein